MINADTAATLGVWMGAFFTLLVFSYLLGDTPLFRFAQAVFVGVTIGYATTVAVYQVLVPQLMVPLLTGNLLFLIPLLGGLLLLLKLRPAWAVLGNIPLAYLFGVGGAVAIGGALSGALLPQLGATVLSFSPFQNADLLVNNLILAVGTIGALLSFRFVTGGGPPVVRVLEAVARRWGYVGRWFVLISFGAIFAETAVSRISILVSRIYYLLHNAFNLVP